MYKGDQESNLKNVLVYELNIKLSLSFVPFHIPRLTCKAAVLTVTVMLASRMTSTYLI